MALPSVLTRFDPATYAEAVSGPKRFYEVVTHFLSDYGRKMYGVNVTQRCWLTRAQLDAILETGYRVTVLRESDEAPQ